MKRDASTRKRYGSEAAVRRRLLRQVAEAKDFGDVLAMGAALAAVNQWLGQHGFDWGVLDARDELRRAYRVKANAFQDEEDRGKDADSPDTS